MCKCKPATCIGWILAAILAFGIWFYLANGSKESLPSGTLVRDIKEALGRT